MQGRETGGVNPLLITGVLIIAAVSGWWLLLREPPLEPGQLRVTYEHGEKCIWQDWTFRVRREVANNRASGNMLIAGRPGIESRDDDWLRVYSPGGDPLNVHPVDLRQLKFSMGSVSGSSNREVRSLDLVTVSETTTFEPVELPRFSRSRVLVPVASRYWADHSDDYMSWGNVRMTLAGTADPNCSTDREIPLTRPAHSKNRTPVLIEFGY